MSEVPFNADEPAVRDRVKRHVAALARALVSQGGMLATAESCTGGLIAAACTDLAGSSAWFERGVVSYSNRCKVELLGVPEALLIAHGAVSEPVARAMAEGLLARSGASLTLSVTGVAGPGGGSADKPVGTVWLGWARTGHPVRVRRCQFAGDREAVRWQAVEQALLGALEFLLPG